MHVCSLQEIWSTIKIGPCAQRRVKDETTEMNEGGHLNLEGKGLNMNLLPLSFSDVNFLSTDS